MGVLLAEGPGALRSAAAQQRGFCAGTGAARGFYPQIPCPVATNDPTSASSGRIRIGVGSEIAFVWVFCCYFFNWKLLSGGRAGFLPSPRPVPPPPVLLWAARDPAQLWSFVFLFLFFFFFLFSLFFTQLNITVSGRADSTGRCCAACRNHGEDLKRPGQRRSGWAFGCPPPLLKGITIS